MEPKQRMLIQPPLERAYTALPSNIRIFIYRYLTRQQDPFREFKVSLRLLEVRHMTRIL
jgi:hypothetical protein